MGEQGWAGDFGCPQGMHYGQVERRREEEKWGQGRFHTGPEIRVPWGVLGPLCA